MCALAMVESKVKKGTVSRTFLTRLGVTGVSVAALHSGLVCIALLWTAVGPDLALNQSDALLLVSNRFGLVIVGFAYGSLSVYLFRPRSAVNTGIALIL